MESINFEKIQALKKYKQQQFINSLMFYPLVGLTCGIFCTSPFWFPTLYSSTKNFFFVLIPNILCLFFNVKSLFILGNLIIIFLLKESKVYALCSSSPSPEQKIDVVRDIKEISKGQRELEAAEVEVVEEQVVHEEQGSEEMEVSEEKCEVEDLEEDEFMPFEEELLVNSNNNDEILTDELNKRAESFIAMVNKQIRLEVADYHGVIVV